MEIKKEKKNHLEVWIAVLIALVSLTTALAAWRTASLGSTAGDLIYKGLLDADKRQAAASNDWQQAYQYAGYERDFLIMQSGVDARKTSTDPAIVEQVTQLSTYLLPGMETLANPSGTKPFTFSPEGFVNVEKRFAELEAQAPDLTGLDPQASFAMADTYYAEQRWLVVGTILITVSLFWLGLSQLSHLRSRILILGLGVLVFGIGLVWSLGVEGIFFIIRAGVK